MARHPQVVCVAMHRRARSILARDERFVVVLALVSATLCAVGVARGANSWLRRRSARDDIGWLAQSITARADRGAFAAVDAHHARDVGTILRRNVFDREAGDLWCATHPADPACASVGGTNRASETAPTSGRATTTVTHAIRACGGEIRVRGVVAASDERWSFALLAGNDSSGGFARRRGDRIEGGEIERVGWDAHVGGYVVLREPAGESCFYAQVMPPAADRLRPARPTSSDGARGAAAAGDDGSITRTGPGEVTVERTLIRRVMDNPIELMQTLRIVPQGENGRIASAQIFGVRAGSLLDRLGLHNGDVLRAIDGREIGGPDRLLEILSRLPTIDRMTLSLTRQGAPLNLDVIVR